MSYDRQIDQVCPHFVIDEALFVSPGDRRTIRPLQPIASSESVVVRLNGAFDVPSFGVHLPAQVAGSKPGPFAIAAGVNDQLVFSVNQGTDQTVVLPASKQMTAGQVVELLNRSARGLQFFVVRDRVAFRTSSEGSGASAYLRSSSTLASTLGISSNREYRGKQVTSGWSLVSDPSTLSDRPTRLVVFDEPLKDFRPFVEISYNTVRQDCRRCGGLGVEHDWRYGRTGEVSQVRDEALLLQEVQKLFYTTIGSNPFHLWYGTSLIELIGRKQSSGGVVQNMIIADIYKAFQRWQEIKRQQEEAVGQTVSDEEYPYKLLKVALEQSTSDPTVIFVKMTVQNRSLRPIQLDRGLKLPEPLDLLGSTSQQGVFRQSLSNNVLIG